LLLIIADTERLVMMEKIKLSEDQESLMQQIKDLMNIYMDSLKNSDYDKGSILLDKMAHLAVNLHNTLDVEPVFTKSVLNHSKDLQIPSVEFYGHYHTVEDLITWLEDPSANVSPEDVTLNKEFEFRVYGSRFGHDDIYRLKRTKTGWHFSFNAYKGNTDHGGSPVLNQALEHDFISYPSTINDYIGSIWREAADKGLSVEEVQDRLNQVADWVSSCEKNAPRHLLN
jgi:hypothetical protein